MTTQQPFIFTEWVRGQIRDGLALVARILVKLGVHPDLLTLAGLGVVAVAALFIARGQFQVGAVILVLGLPLDALDGAVARAMQRPGRFGGVLDSSLDRYADALIFGGLSYHFAVHDQFDLMLLAMAAQAGSFVVSYVRARAGESGLSVKVGLFDRFVRVIVIMAGLFVPAIITPVLWMLAIGTNFTGLQRLWYVYKNTQ
jgi:CDP-diacylglycerol--glycerol-3-phosphate 3-phosphatidyltransferase